GELESWRAGELESWRAGELESWRAGELESWRAGELESWRAGELESWIIISSREQVLSILSLQRFFHHCVDAHSRRAKPDPVFHKRSVPVIPQDEVRS
ncbi:hypothetical protein, partial [Vibrio tubiashii]